MKNKKHILFLFIISLIFCQSCFAQDLVFTGIYEAAIDLPRIYFQIKNHTPAKDFEPHYAFLDTGASGILLSSETAEKFAVTFEPNAQFMDVGIGGNEYFKVTQPIKICIAGFETPNPENPGAYKCYDPWRVQVKKSNAELLSEPLDVIGMPAMAGNLVILNSGATNSLSFFAAEIKKQKGPGPKADLKVALKFKNFLNPNLPGIVPPLPVTAANPMLENISVTYNGKTSKATWILDTGATISLISTRQAAILGITDANGNPLVKSSFSVPLGGIGKMSMIEGYQIDSLAVPTTDGRNIIFKNARIGVHNVKYIDPEKNTESVIDGVFGSNFLCSSAKMDGLLPSDIAQSPFNYIIIDFQENTLGFDLLNKTNSPNPKPRPSRKSPRRD